MAESNKIDKLLAACEVAKAAHVKAKDVLRQARRDVDVAQKNQVRVEREAERKIEAAEVETERKWLAADKARESEVRSETALKEAKAAYYAAKAAHDKDNH